MPYTPIVGTLAYVRYADFTEPGVVLELDAVRLGEAVVGEVAQTGEIRRLDDVRADGPGTMSARAISACLVLGLLAVSATAQRTTIVSRRARRRPPRPRSREAASRIGRSAGGSAHASADSR